jgi:hypothetical protein
VRRAWAAKLPGRGLPCLKSGFRETSFEGAPADAERPSRDERRPREENWRPEGRPNSSAIQLMKRPIFRPGARPAVNAKDQQSTLRLPSAAPRCRPSPCVGINQKRLEVGLEAWTVWTTDAVGSALNIGDGEPH